MLPRTLRDIGIDAVGVAPNLQVARSKIEAGGIDAAIDVVLRDEPGWTCSRGSKELRRSRSVGSQRRPLPPIDAVKVRRSSIVDVVKRAWVTMPRCDVQYDVVFVADDDTERGFLAKLASTASRAVDPNRDQFRWR